nr:hypothetical protein [Actinophytocola sp.]
MAAVGGCSTSVVMPAAVQAVQDLGVGAEAGVDRAGLRTADAVDGGQLLERGRPEVVERAEVGGQRPADPAAGHPDAQRGDVASQR